MRMHDHEIVALSGAHTVGKAHALRSGHDGPWTARPQHFDNAYFVDLLGVAWEASEEPGGKTVHRPKLKAALDRRMMLPTDVALLDDPNMRKWVELYARDQGRWFQDFAAAFTKLQELGVPAFHHRHAHDEL